MKKIRIVYTVFEEIEVPDGLSDNEIQNEVESRNDDFETVLNIDILTLMYILWI